VGVTSPKIQEVGEGSGAGLKPEIKEDGTQITDIMRSSYEGEEAASYCLHERGLRWARRAFDELILPVTTVNPLDPGT
jgi:hypothetical protein